MNGSALLDVLKEEKPSRRPVWFMRQAGRYLPEYRELRTKAGSFLKLCYMPELAAEVTLQPLRRFDLDAAIVFADILVVPQAMGVGLRFEDGEGPVVEKIAEAQRVASLKLIDGAEEVSLVCETIRRVKAELPDHVALIGFCGAPWTVASYMIGGGGENGREQARAAALLRRPWFDDLLDRLVTASASYLLSQIEAGADVVQIFDSWAGDLPGYAQDELVSKPIAQIVRQVKASQPNVPVIVFARGAGAGHVRIGAETNADCLGVETSLPLDWARETLASRYAVQGNLDPLLVEIGGDAMLEGVDKILDAMPAGRHVFNLGHGIRPQTPPEHVGLVVSRIRERDGAS